ncbi:MAG: THUMP domain-containing class I SAM-dependent RNA methyltransferase [Pseudomonadota bacterium]
MTAPADFEIFASAPPGLEPALAEEAREKGFDVIDAVPGGVRLRGGWPEVWRANLELRGAGRVLARIASFRALHLAQLDKRARRVPWAEVLRPDIPVRVEAACQASRIYHDRAAGQRVARAISETLGAPVTPDAKLRVLARIEDDLCTISLDTSGEPLHRRGHKEAVAKAPLRETLAALFLRRCGYRGEEPVLDPMCGSGTFVIEAAEIAAGLPPGRSRHFAFEDLASFDPDAWVRLREGGRMTPPPLTFRGYDRDAGAVEASRANAARAGVDAFAEFRRQTISELTRPEGPPGLVMVNPPYGGRIGNKKLLRALYATLGERLRTGFSGWRVGLVTNEPGLAHASGLPFGPDEPVVSHGGLKIRLYRTGPLP